ncbi:MAG: hypothetical protein VX951_13065 [Planctomycetota bacterium]|nr:hypothetical protein [Planctomycetota bacterium]
MRFTSILSLLALTSASAAQSTTVTPISKMGVFAQLSGNQPRFSTLPNSASVTRSQPLAVLAEVTDGNATVGHARTKASLRLIENLPALRIYESGFITAIPTVKKRASGTCGAATTVGTVAQPHAWLIQHSGTPGQRVRVHIRLRSNLSGASVATGNARVDVGNDSTFEFDRPLDGRRFLGNKAVTIGASGSLDVKVETAALLTSTGMSAASYAMTFDVSFEPVQGVVASFTPYGPICGADVYGISWTQSGKRVARLVVDNAAPNASAFGLFGLSRIQIPLPSAICPLLNTADIIMPTRTDAVGRIITNLIPIPKTTILDLKIQYVTLSPPGLHFSKGLRFEAKMASALPYDHFDVNHILSGGQSLAMGGLGTPVLSKTQNYKNCMFDAGLRSQSTRLAPLVENYWETMSSGMSNTISELHKLQYNNNGSQPPQTHDVLVSIHAQPGSAYTQLKRGTPAFTDGMNQHRLAQFIVDSQSKNYTVRCVTIVHGEEDHQRINYQYSKDLVEWQKDYETEVQRRGQTRPIPMLHTQLSSFTSFSTSWSFIPREQLIASVANPRKIPLVGPKYIFEYIDGIHLLSTAYRRMGEYYGKVYSHIFLEGGTWEPLRPLSIKQNGASIRVRFHVPEPPLVLDTSAVKDPGNFGFNYQDSSTSPPSIKSVSLVDEDTVEIQLSAIPSPAAVKYLGYAWNGISGAKSGPVTGARGNLRDSDSTPSIYKTALHNWCVHFLETLR